MYLQDGREIYESDKYPGYYIDANTGDFCDAHGNYVGGNQDNGDTPGRIYYFDNEIVFLTKSGKQYYPAGTKSATIPITLSEAKKKGYKASAGYKKFKVKQLRNKLKEL